MSLALNSVAGSMEDQIDSRLTPPGQASMAYGNGVKNANLLNYQ
jgi:hypothetical protein